MAPRFGAEALARIRQVTDVAPIPFGQHGAVEGARTIGRGTELERGRAVLADATLSRGRALLLEGPPGIGKSTVLDELARDAAAQGLVVLRAACDEPGTHRPFAVFIDLLGLGRPGADPRCEAVEALVFESAPHAAGAHAPDLRVRIGDELVALLEALSLDSPVALIVDDLQWADTSSIGALGQLLLPGHRRRLSFIGAHRPSPHLAVLTAERLVVDGLDDEGVHALLTDMCGAPPDASLVEVTRRAGGNPLFVTELVSALRQEDRLAVEGGRAKATGGDVPQSVHDTVRRRMDELPRETLSALTVAAVLSEPFSLEDLAVVMGTDGVDVYTVIEPAVRAQFVEAVGERFDFRHDVVREALYLELPLPARRAFHLKVARALAAAGASAQRVARHFSLGAEPGDLDAAEWLRHAGAELTPYAPATALELLQHALALVPRPSPMRAPVLADLMTAAFQSGAFALCERSSRELLGEATDTKSRLAAHSARLGMHIVLENYTDALREVEAALCIDGLPEADRALLLSLLASMRMATGDVARALPLASEAMELGRATNVAYATGRALTVEAGGRRLFGAYSEAADLARQSLREYVPSSGTTFRNQSASHDLFQAYVVNAPMLIEADHFDEAEDVLRRATMGFADLGQVPMLVLAHRILGNLLFHAGRWDEALAELATASAASPHVTGARVMSGDPLPEMLARMDDLAGANAALERALDAVDAEFPHPGTLWVVRGRAYLAEAEGRTGDAIGALRALHDVAHKVGMVPDIRAVSVPLVRHLVAAGQRDIAEKALVDIEADAARAADVASVQAAALLARAIVTDDPAALDMALATSRRSPRMLALAVALEDAGTRPWLDDDRRVAHLEEARSLYESMGAARDARRVSAELRALGVRSGARHARKRAAFGWESLTASEIRVVELLSEGLTNPQIGERLYLSRKTVATHVSAALRKLGVGSRTEIAAIVARRGER